MGLTTWMRMSFGTETAFALHGQGYLVPVMQVEYGA